MEKLMSRMNLLEENNEKMNREVAELKQGLKEAKSLNDELKQESGDKSIGMAETKRR